MAQRAKLCTMLIIISLSILASCTGTKLISTWREENYQGHTAKLFVIAAVNDRGSRKLIEDEFVRQLKERGTNAVASYTVFPADMKVTKKAVLSQVKEVGSDAILALRLVRKRAEEAYTPVRIYAVPQNFDENWDQYYGVPEYDRREVSHDYDLVSIETMMFDAATRRPLWMTLSETKYQGALLKQLTPFVRVIIQNLSSENLLSATGTPQPNPN